MSAFVEENFFNIGLADHPLQALNRQVRNDPSFRDTGGEEITFRASDRFKFRTLTLRQLKDGRTFMHNGLFTSVQQVVEYFNAGVPQDPEAGAAATFSRRFSQPRGPGSKPGLRLSERHADDLTAFRVDGLDDPGFVIDDPKSPTCKFGPTTRDLAYSKEPPPDLGALGARDGFMPGGLAVAHDDPLSRRDLGLEFLDVTQQAQVAGTSSDRAGTRQNDTDRIINNGSRVIDTQLLLVVENLSDRRARLRNGSGTTKAGHPYLRVFLDNGVLPPGGPIEPVLRFERPAAAGRLTYRLKPLSAQGRP